MIKILLALLLINLTASNLSSFGNDECPLVVNGVKWASVTTTQYLIQLKIAANNPKNIFKVLQKYGARCGSCFSESGATVRINDLLLLKYNDAFIEYRIDPPGDVGEWVEEPDCRWYCFYDLHNALSTHCG